jgi:hypothetical protein
LVLSPQRGEGAFIPSSDPPDSSVPDVDPIV